MRVLSLFDGVSCGREAFKQLDIPVEYYASEIDQNAIAIAKQNSPDIIEIGDVKNVRGDDYKGIDIIIGGSPCQDLSSLNKIRRGLEGEKSGLFFEYLRLLREIQPKIFFLENVASMRKIDRDRITEELKKIRADVTLYKIDSIEDCQCHRRRLYWTNLKPSAPVPFPVRKMPIRETKIKIPKYNAFWLNRKETEFYKIGTACGGRLSPLYTLGKTEGYCYEIEPEAVIREMGYPDNYFEGISKSAMVKAICNSWNIKTIKRFFSGLCN